MAEFEYIMSQASRLCNMHPECVDCPFIGGCLTPSMRNAKEAEQVILDWAKAHPEPVYPSWEEGWKQLFPDGYMACPNDLFDAHLPCTVGCAQCVERPMPPHIAEKLGIKPIGGK